MLTLLEIRTLGNQPIGPIFWISHIQFMHIFVMARKLQSCLCKTNSRELHVSYPIRSEVQIFHPQDQQGLKQWHDET